MRCFSGVYRRGLLLGIIVFLGNPSWSEATEILRIATWNLNNLHDEIGVPLRDRAPSRSRDDFALLRKYAKRLNADVIALQEVNGPKAARHVFPEAQYDLYFSGRYVEDQETGRESDRIYTGVAIRRDVFVSCSGEYLFELAVRKEQRLMNSFISYSSHEGKKV